MLDLLRELDAGTGALPRGSEVVLLNAHPEERVAGHLEQVRGGSGLRSIRLRHVRANPLTHEGVSQARRRPPNPRLPYSCPAPCRASWGTPCCRQVVCPPPPQSPAASVHPCQRGHGGCRLAGAGACLAPNLVLQPAWLCAAEPSRCAPHAPRPPAASTGRGQRAQVDMRGVTASLVLSDVLWRDSGVDNGGAGAVAGAPAGALEKMAEADYLRLDSLLLTCQLHVRGLLQARRPPRRPGPDDIDLVLT